MVAAPADADENDAREYVDAVDRLDLQDELEILSEDTDWREYLGVEERETGQTRSEIELSRILVWLLAAGVVGFILFLVIRYGAAIQVGFNREAGRDEIDEAAPVVGLEAAAGRKVASLEDVLAIRDEDQALGALLRLVLESALEAMEMSLKRSETARAVLRRLPRDWEHFGPVASLVRLAERVRYAGDMIDRATLIEAVEQSRPVISARRGVS